MAGDLFAGQGKKLIAIGLFLVLVAVLVGGEDNPGVIGGLADADVTIPANTTSSAPVEQVSAPPPPVRSDDPELSSWYARSESSGAVDPEPVQPITPDNSHLINDARPLVSTSPEAAASAVMIDGTLTEQ